MGRAQRARPVARLRQAQKKPARHQAPEIPRIAGEKPRRRPCQDRERVDPEGAKPIYGESEDDATQREADGETRLDAAVADHVEIQLGHHAHAEQVERQPVHVIKHGC